MTRTYGNLSHAGFACATAELSCATRWSARTCRTAPTQKSPMANAALFASTVYLPHHHATTHSLPGVLVLMSPSSRLVSLPELGKIKTKWGISPPMAVLLESCTVWEGTTVDRFSHTGLRLLLGWALFGNYESLILWKQTQWNTFFVHDQSFFLNLGAIKMKIKQTNKKYRQ